DGETVSKQAALVTVREDGTISIDTIDQNVASSGVRVSLTGSGFDGDTDVWVGSTSALKVEVASDTSLSFVVPSLPAGDYQVKVVSDEGESNTVMLKIEAPIKARLSVSGVDAP